MADLLQFDRCGNVCCALGEDVESTQRGKTGLKRAPRETGRAFASRRCGSMYRLTLDLKWGLADLGDCSSPTGILSCLTERPLDTSSTLIPGTERQYSITE